MFQIDDPTAVPAPPAPPAAGTPGFFAAGNPATGTPATKIRFWWLNMIQQELAAICAAAGIALNKGNQAQVIASLQSLFGPGRRVAQPLFIDQTTSIGVFAGANSYIIEAVGGGGSGAAAPPTSSTQGSAAGGGGGAAYGRIWLTAAQFTAAMSGGTLPITIGQGGAASGAQGNAGTATNVGNGLLVCPGGNGGASVPATAQGYAGGGASSGLPTTSLPSTQLLEFVAGQAGGVGIVLSPSSIVSGVGGMSRWGTGGDLTNGTVQLTGNNGSGRGSGGSGGGAIANAGAVGNGGAGMPGRVIVTAYT